MRNCSPEVKKRVRVLGEVSGVNRLDGFLQRRRLHQTVCGVTGENLCLAKRQSAIPPGPRRAALAVFPVLRTVDEEDEDAFLDRVVCVGDEAFHLESQLLVLAADLDELPGNAPEGQSCRQCHDTTSSHNIKSLASACQRAINTC